MGGPIEEEVLGSRTAAVIGNCQRGRRMRYVVEEHRDGFRMVCGLGDTGIQATFALAIQLSERKSGRSLPLFIMEVNNAVERM